MVTCISRIEQSPFIFTFYTVFSVFAQQYKTTGGISVIPQNTEKYTSFSWKSFVFIDSLAFLNASLDRLVQSTPREVFHHLSEEFADPRQLELVMRKGVYPYEYITDLDKFDETSLPPREAFYSSLTDEVSMMRCNLLLLLLLLSYVVFPVGLC